jgi:hypothetical protein
MENHGMESISDKEKLELSQIEEEMKKEEFCSYSEVFN